MDWWSHWHLMPIVSYQWRVTTTHDGKTAWSHSWEVEASTVNSLVGTLFHVIITRMGTDLIFLSRLGSTICVTNFRSHEPRYTEPCYKGSVLYLYILDGVPLKSVSGQKDLGITISDDLKSSIVSKTTEWGWSKGVSLTSNLTWLTTYLVVSHMLAMRKVLGLPPGLCKGCYSPWLLTIPH